MDSVKCSSSYGENYIEYDKDFMGEAVETFAFEMFHYLLVRRLCTQYVTRIAPSEFTLFTEEIGKAVLLKWYEEHKSFRKLLTDDFPKYVNTSEIFRSYATDCCFQFLDDDKQSIVDCIQKITAFLLEMACFCFEKGYIDFIGHIHKDWTKIFLEKCVIRLKRVGGWLTLIETCAEKSILYNRRRIEKKDDVCTHFKLKYLTPLDLDNKEIVALGTWKTVTNFQTYDLKTESFIPPSQYPKI